MFFFEIWADGDLRALQKELCSIQGRIQLQPDVCIPFESGAGEVVGRKTRASYVLRIALQKRLQVVSLG